MKFNYTYWSTSWFLAPFRLVVDLVICLLVSFYKTISYITETLYILDFSHTTSAEISAANCFSLVPTGPVRCINNIICSAGPNQVESFSAVAVSTSNRITKLPFREAIVYAVYYKADNPARPDADFPFESPS